MTDEKPIESPIDSTERTVEDHHVDERVNLEPRTNTNNYVGKTMPYANQYNLTPIPAGSYSMPAQADSVNSGMVCAIASGPNFFPTAIYLSETTDVEVDFTVSPISMVQADLASNMGTNEGTTLQSMWVSQNIPDNGVVPINYRITGFRILNSSGSIVRADWTC